MTSAISVIARKEFYQVFYNPMVILIGMILIILTYINGAGGYINLQTITVTNRIDGFIIGFSQIWYITNFICGIMAAYLGVMTISEERNKGSLGILLTKPLYRRDVILGKFIGLTIFSLIFLIITMLVNSLVLFCFYGAPSSIYEFLWRIAVYTLILLMDLSLVTGLTMLIGVVFRDLMLAISVVVTYLSYEWFWNPVTSNLANMLHFPVSPYMLTHKILGEFNISDIFSTNISFSTWINAVYPYVFLMIFLVVIVLLLDCFIYARIEDA